MSLANSSLVESHIYKRFTLIKKVGSGGLWSCVESVVKINQKDLRSEENIRCVPACHRRATDLPRDLDSKADKPPKHHQAPLDPQSQQWQRRIPPFLVHLIRLTQRDFFRHSQRYPHQVHHLSSSFVAEIPSQWLCHPP